MFAYIFLWERTLMSADSNMIVSPFWPISAWAIIIIIIMSSSCDHRFSIFRASRTDSTLNFSIQCGRTILYRPYSIVYASKAHTMPDPRLMRFLISSAHLGTSSFYSRDVFYCKLAIFDDKGSLIWLRTVLASCSLRFDYKQAQTTDFQILNPISVRFWDPGG